MYDVVIVGAGQAGLSMGYYLNATNLSFLIVDKREQIGDVWRQRYDSLTLFTPRSHSSLPGLTLNGNQNTFPTKDEMADYLLKFSKTFDLPVQLNTNVQSLLQTDSGFKIFTNQGELASKNIVIATGPFQIPNIPHFSKELPDTVYQLHSSDYKNLSQLKSGSVLVVGGGNSGAQIAVELSKEKEVYFSVGHKMKFFPLMIGNKSTFSWFDKLGLLEVKGDSKIGGKMKNQKDPIMGLELKSLIKKGRVNLKPRTISIQNDRFLFSDNSVLKVDNVVWSTGFRSDYSWIHLPSLFDDDGNPIHDRGVTPVKGMYFLGLPWQHRKNSALINGVGKDAAYLLQQIVKNKE